MGKQLASVVTALSIFSAGCETMGGAVATGAGTGAALGAGAGMLIDPGAKGEGRIKNVVVGTAGGALLGAGAGYLVQKSSETNRKEAYDRGKTDAQKEVDAQASATGEPPLLPPKVEAHYVPDQVRGAVFIPGHVEYRIVRPARWSSGAPEGEQ